MQKQREHWGSHLGFVLAAAGSAIGLGTLWQVPYVTGENGGGLFVLIYILCTFLIGVPVFIAELVLGRRSQRGAVGTFIVLAHDSAIWKVGGWLGVLSSFLIMSYYSVIAGWGMNYAFMSLNQFYENRSAQEISQIFETLVKSGDITLFWHFAFIALTVAVVYPGVKHGIEYWSKFMTSSLFVMLCGLCCYSFTLSGFGEAVSFLFSPDFSRFKPSSALEALGLSFFTLSVGQGIMITYGSYMRRNEDIPKTGGLIGITIVVVAILAGLTIFPIIFTYGFQPQQGEGLVFKTLPLLFGKLQGALFISTIFFILFVFAALTSSIAMVEVVAANLMDLYGWNRHQSVIFTGVAMFIAGIPSALAGTDWIFSNWTILYGKNFFATVNSLVSSWLLPIGGLLIALFSGWVLDKEISRDEFCAGTKLKWIWAPWRFFVRWVAPAGIILIILQKAGIIDLDKLLS
jgi:NSS family neurotransmitter:Na+ symporter